MTVTEGWESFRQEGLADGQTMNRAPFFLHPSDFCCSQSPAPRICWPVPGLSCVSAIRYAGGSLTAHHSEEIVQSRRIG